MKLPPCVRTYLGNVRAAYDKECGLEQDAAAEIPEEARLADVLVEVENMNLSSAEAFVAANPNHASTPALSSAVAAAQRRVHGLVTLLVDQEQGLGKELADTVAAKIQGQDKAYTVWVLDTKTLCEAGSQAKYRIPATRPSQIQRLCTAVLECRGGSLQDGDVMVCLDAGKENVETLLCKSLSMPLPKGPPELLRHMIVYDQASCEARMERTSKAPLDLTERALIVSMDTVNFKAAVPTCVEKNVRV